ncbi:MAG: YfhO family protein [Muribaculaceae bacterium]|nr:YfhO family protein [Muribaculaceae bacterium]
MSAPNFSDRIIAWFERPRVWGFFLSVAIMAIVALVFFYPDNFEGNTLQQPDMVQGAANGQEGVAVEEATGEKALWTNSLFGGMPTFQISPSYPSNALFEWLNDLYGLWLPAPSNLLFMMMFGFFILLYAMDMRWYYALLGSVAWGFSSYFVIIIGAGHIWKFVALSYIPPTIAGLVLCYRGRYLAGAALTALFAMLQLNANHPQMSYYFAFVMAGMALAYLCGAVKDKKVKQWLIASGCLLGAGALALGANLPALYNTYEYAKETDRGASELGAITESDNAAQEAESAKAPTGGMDYSQIVAWSYTPSESLSLLVPNIKGGATARPVGGANQPVTLSEIDGSDDGINPHDAQIMQMLPQYFNDTEGTNGPVYVGAIVCMLFLLGCLIVKGPMKWALLILTLFSLLAALGRHFEWFTDLLVYNLPMYNKFRAVESILVIAEFTMPLLAVMGLKEFFSAEKPFEKFRWQAIVSVAVPAAVCLLAVIAPGIAGDAITSYEKEALLSYNQQGYIADYASLIGKIESLRYGLVQSDAWRSLLFICLGAAVLYAVCKGWLKRTHAVCAIAALVLIDLYSVDHRYVDSDNFVKDTVQLSDPLAADALDMEILQDKDLSYRVADFDNFGAARRSYYHKMVGGYHAAKLGRYNDLITRNIITSPQILDMLNTRYVILNGQVSKNPYALGNGWFVGDIRYVDGAKAEFDALQQLEPGTSAVADARFKSILGEASATTEGDAVTLTGYTPNRLTYDVKSANGGVAVFSEVYFPWGWHATIDGKAAELGRVNYLLRAMRIPAGNHKVEMVFDPESLHVTGGIAYASVTLIYLLLAGAVFTSVFRKKKSANPKP